MRFTKMMKQASKPSFVSPKKNTGDGYSTDFGICIPNSCSLPEDPNEADRLASGHAAGISSYLALLHAEIARFTLRSEDRSIVTVALIRAQFVQYNIELH